MSAHVGYLVLERRPHSVQVRGHGPIPFLHSEVGHAARHQHAGVVERDIQPPGQPHRVGNGALDLPRHGDVGPDGECQGARSLGLSDRLGESVPVPAGDDNGGPFLGKSHGHGSADAPAPANHKHRLPVKSAPHIRCHMNHSHPSARTRWTLSPSNRFQF